MPRDGSLTPADLLGMLDTLVVQCDKSGRKGSYSVTRLKERYGADAKLSDWLARMTADCPKRNNVDWSDRCAAEMPDLAKVFLDSK